MNVLDVNVLAYAYRREVPRHSEFKKFLDSLANHSDPFAIPAVVFSGFLRITTHPRIYTLPSPIEKALEFAERVQSLSHCITLVPGPRHWRVFAELCRIGNARGGLVSDAYLAAMTIEIGGELITADRGFGRWPGLRWRHPLDD
jgi:uncharacterized protein